MNDSNKIALLAEDDMIFRRLLAKKLTVAGYQVHEAENGMVAKAIFDANPTAFNLVITDVKMPELDGVQLLSHLRKTSQVPVVIMTGFSEILESKAAFELGANGFLPKPFKGDTLFEAIDQAFNPLKDRKPEGPPIGSRFCQIHMSEFIAATHLASDLYVKLSDAKYIKVAHKGDTIPVDRLKVYQERKVDYLYVAVEDFASYVKFSIQISKVAYESNKVSKAMKLRLMQATTQTIVEQCFISEISPESLAPAKQMLENTLELVSSDEDILQLIASLDTQSNKIYSHSVAVSFFACMIARAHGWKSANTLFKVSISGLLHDIGKRELSPELLKKSRLQLGASEIKLLETHPLRGREIVSKVSALPEDIAQIIAQHHENVFGSGFPLRLKGDAIHPIARILAVADRFCSLIMPLDPAVIKVSPKEAAIKINLFYADELDPIFIKALMNVLQVDEDAPGRSVASRAAAS